MSQIDLLTDATATGASAFVAFAGRYLAVVQGTLDGATVTLEMLGPDGTNYVTLPDFSKTAAGSGVVYLPAGAMVRGAVAGGTAPTGLYLSLYRMEG